MDFQVSYYDFPKTIYSPSETHLRFSEVRLGLKSCVIIPFVTLILLPMVSSKLLELENAVNNLSLEEKIWLLEKIVVQMRELTKVANFQFSVIASDSEAISIVPGNLNTNSEDDPLIGLFAGSPDLATNSEEILQEEITDKSGWTYKEMSL